MVVNSKIGYAECIIKFNNNNSRVLLFKDELGKPINVQGFCRMIEIYSETSLPLFGRYDRVNWENELEFTQRCLWEYDKFGNPISNYIQENWGKIVIYTPNDSQTVYDFDDEYNEISNKIDYAQDSLIEMSFGNLDVN